MPNAFFQPPNSIKTLRPLFLALQIFHISSQMKISRELAQQSKSESTALPDVLFQLLNLPSKALPAISLSEENIRKMSSSRRMRPLDNNGQLSFGHRRAICPYQFVLNQRQNRVPRTLIEVKCLRRRPSKGLFNGKMLAQLECRPMHWTMHVLECQEVAGEESEGLSYQCREAKERISLGCIPLLKADGRELGQDENEGAEDFVSIPANPFDGSLEGK